MTRIGQHSAFVLALAATTLVAAPRPAMAQQFEGVITARMHGDNTTATYSIKGDKLRLDMAMDGATRASSIIDRGARKMILLMHEQQMYMERDFDTTTVGGGVPQAGAADFTWTGTHQTIAGMSCDDGVFTARDGSRTNMCIARGISFFGGPGMRRGPARDSWQSHVQGGFPLKVQRAGDDMPVMEVTSIDRRSLADALFAPPAGWRRMTMPMGGPPPQPGR